MSSSSTKYYKVIVKIFTEELSKKGMSVTKERKHEFVIEAVTVGDAETKANDWMKGSVDEFEVFSVTETKIEAVVK